MAGTYKLVAGKSIGHFFETVECAGRAIFKVEASCIQSHAVALVVFGTGWRANASLRGTELAGITISGRLTAMPGRISSGAPAQCEEGEKED